MSSHQAVDACEPVAVLTDVGRTFPGAPPTVALRNATLRLDRGEFVSIMGPSGSGKSTLLHMLGLLDTPTNGSLRLFGEETATLDEQTRASLRAERIGFVFQAFYLLPNRTAVENVMLADAHARRPRRGRRARASTSLMDVGLSHRLEVEARHLSGGELQRTAIARALVSEPALLLADEPTGNLDSDNARTVMRLLRALHARGLTIVMITHDKAVADNADRVVTIHNGILD